MIEVWLTIALIIISILIIFLSIIYIFLNKLKPQYQFIFIGFLFIIISTFFFYGWFSGMYYEHMNDKILIGWTGPIEYPITPFISIVSLLVGIFFFYFGIKVNRINR